MFSLLAYLHRAYFKSSFFCCGTLILLLFLQSRSFTCGGLHRSPKRNLNLVCHLQYLFCFDLRKRQLSNASFLINNLIFFKRYTLQLFFSGAGTFFNKNKSLVFPYSSNVLCMLNFSRANLHYNLICCIYTVFNIIHKQQNNIYQNGKEIMQRHQVLRVSCKHELQSSVCT